MKKFLLLLGEFYNGTFRFFVTVLSVGLCISGCMGLFLQAPTPRPWISFKAGIQPLPENHGRWSKEEVDTVIDTIVTAAKQHGLKKKWDPDQGYTLSGKYFVLSLDACFLYDMGGIRHKSPSLLEAQSSSPFKHLSLRRLNIQKERGTIYLKIELISFRPQIVDSDRLLVENIWHEVLNPLRNKFGERIEEGSHIRIY